MHHILVWFQPAVFARNVALVAESNLIFCFWFTKQIVSVLCHSRLSKIWDSNISMEFIFPEIHVNHPTPRRLKRITDIFFAKIGWPVLIAPLFMSQWGAHCYLDVNVNEHDFSNVIEIHKKQEIPLWFCVCEINLSSLRVVFSVWTEGDAKGPRRASCWCLFVISLTTKGHKQGNSQAEKIIPLRRCTIKF